MRHDVGDLIDAHAFGVGGGVLSSRRIRAVLSLAVHPGQLGRELHLLGQQLWLPGRGGRIQLHQHHLPAQIRRQSHLIPAMALFDQLQDPGRDLLTHHSGCSLRVVGDVGFCCPLGVRRIGAAGF